MIDTDVLEQIADALNDGPDAVHRTVVDLVEQRQECEETPEKNPMDTLGSLVDKLTTVSLKMWHNQERLYEIRRMSRDEFCSRWGDDLAGLHDVVRRCCDLNVQRSSLMDEIDKFLLSAVSGQVAPEDLVRLQHKTY